MTQRNIGPAAAVRDAYRALQAGDFAGAARLAAPWTSDPSAALLHALGRAGAGEVEAGAAALHAISRANPGARHPALDLAELLQTRGHDPAPHLRAALVHAPEHPFLLSALAAAMLDSGQLDAAIAAFQQVTAVAPGNPGAWSNLGKALATQNRFAEAASAFAAAAVLPHAEPQIRLNHAVATLKSGRLAEAWPLFHARHQLPGRPPPPAGPALQTPAQAAGRTVLLLHNEGYGDTLQFIRYAALLAAAGARVPALVPPQLRRLLRESGFEMVEDTAPAYDFWCHIPDLPGVFGTTLDTIPASLPYLRADPGRAARWAAHLPSGRRIGLVWAGEARLHDAGAAATDRLRSIAPSRLAPLLATPGLQWISLQFGQRPPPGLHDPMPDVTDFADTAAIIANLDVVVSVDTAVAHLAAAMGKPVMLLDRYDNCWRWLSAREDSPWYPGAMHIIRQTTPGDWDGVLRRAADRLTAQFTL